MGAAIDRTEPGPLGWTALEAWSFLGGWFPERLPLFGQLRELPDVHELMELIMHVRDAINEMRN